MKEHNQQENSPSPSTPTRLSSMSSTLQSELTIQRHQIRQELQNVGSKLQQLNLVKLMNHAEQGQNLSTQLESLNEHVREEMKCREIQREAEDACLRSMQAHLEEFLSKRPNASYEQWIEDLHPENAHDGLLLEDMGKEIDFRFYVEDSDHRSLWNKNMTVSLRRIAPQTRMRSDNAIDPQPIDLLTENLEDVLL